MWSSLATRSLLLHQPPPGPGCGRPTPPWRCTSTQNSASTTSSKRSGGGEIVFKQGPCVIRGKVFHNFWKVPSLKIYPVEISYYLEGQRDLFAGLWGAIRYSAIDFLPLSDHDLEYSNTVLPPDVTRDWDFDVSRWQRAEPGIASRGMVGSKPRTPGICPKRQSSRLTTCCRSSSPGCSRAQRPRYSRPRHRLHQAWPRCQSPPGGPSGCVLQSGGLCTV